MAIYHCSVKTVKRSAGRSSTAAAAYRAGAEVCDERTGEIHDYTRRSGVRESFVLSPAHAPVQLQDRSNLWNAVEQIEKRKDAQLAREVVVAIPHELDADQQRQLVADYAQQFVDAGMIADVAIHEPGREGDQRNAHAHIMLTMRDVTEKGFDKKNRAWNSKEMLQGWRESWSHQCNQALEMSGSESRVDHRSYADQGIQLRPTVHLGVAAAAMERRGERTEKGDKNREAQEVNRQIREMQQQHVIHLREFESLVKQRDQLNDPDFLRQQIEQAKQDIAQRHSVSQELLQLSRVTRESVQEAFFKSELREEFSEKRELRSKLNVADSNYKRLADQYTGMSFFKRQFAFSLKRDLSNVVDYCEKLEGEIERIDQTISDKKSQLKSDADDHVKSVMQDVSQQKTSLRKSLDSMYGKEHLEQLENRLEQLEPKQDFSQRNELENELELSL